MENSALTDKTQNILKVLKAIFTVVFLLSALAVRAQMFGAADSMVLKRIFAYKSLHKTDVAGMSMNIYMKSRFRTIKKNKLLLAVPSMYSFSRRTDDDFLGESYLKVNFSNVKDYETIKQVTVGTVPRYRQTLPTMIGFLAPNLYNMTIMEDHLLSPFHTKNAIFYRYGMSYLDGFRGLLAFKPKTHNTQLVSGKAVVDCLTGRIIEVEFEGEYDMITFSMHAIMGE